MSELTTRLHIYFTKLGLSAEIADLYLALYSHGPQSLLQLSRNADVERTRLYRLLDTLLSSQLIEVEEHYKRKTYKAAPLANLQVLFAKRHQEIVDLQEELQELQTKLDYVIDDSPPTHIQFYRGDEGVKQMLWNQTRSKGQENLAILFTNMQAHTKEIFFERWVRRCNERGITSRSIVGDHFLRSQHEWYSKHQNEQLAHWEGRYVSPSVFSIKHSMVIYDDVVAYYNWKDGEAFGSEIYNEEIANTQRQFFEMLWQAGQPIFNYGLEKPCD